MTPSILPRTHKVRDCEASSHFRGTSERYWGGREAAVVDAPEPLPWLGRGRQIPIGKKDPPGGTQIRPKSVLKCHDANDCFFQTSQQPHPGLQHLDESQFSGGPNGLSKRFHHGSDSPMLR